MILHIECKVNLPCITKLADNLPPESVKWTRKYPHPWYRLVRINASVPGYQAKAQSAGPKFGSYLTNELCDYISEMERKGNTG